MEHQRREGQLTIYQCGVLSIVARRSGSSWNTLVCLNRKAIGFLPAFWEGCSTPASRIAVFIVLCGRFNSFYHNTVMSSCSG